MELDELSKIGYGGYRITTDEKEHEVSLKYSLKLGCNLIDTANNYKKGKSEELIGQVLQQVNEQPFIITKAGYLDEKDLAIFKSTEHDIVTIKDRVTHSFHPDILKYKLNLSLSRLQLISVNAFLIHNPEYYFDQENADATVFYGRIKKAFEFLEDCVKRKLIGYYGISSNAFVLKRNDRSFVDLEKIIAISKEVSSASHFKFIQFPLNIIETGALIQNYDGLNLIQYAKMVGLKTLGNRPLMGNLNGHPFKIISFGIDVSDVKKYENAFSDFEELLVSGVENNEVIVKSEIFNTLKNGWKNIKSEKIADLSLNNLKKTVSQNITDKKLVNKLNNATLYLNEGIKLNMRLRMDQRSDKIKKNFFQNESQESLQLLACRKYFEWGIDHILLGMRRVSYVNDFKSLI
jgi:aryl-alcohol dehydrogenase-like predicted oxidoreductase